jgi:hypothetical protein
LGSVPAAIHYPSFPLHILRVARILQTHMFKEQGLVVGTPVGED